MPKYVSGVALHPQQIRHKRVTGGSLGVSTGRLYPHCSLADHWRASAGVGASRNCQVQADSAPAQQPDGQYRLLLEAGVGPRAAPCLWRHLYSHRQAMHCIVPMQGTALVSRQFDEVFLGYGSARREAAVCPVTSLDFRLKGFCCNQTRRHLQPFIAFTKTSPSPFIKQVLQYRFYGICF